MWHLFGPIVRWPLHSPGRLLGVIAMAVAAVLALGAINDRGSKSDAVSPEASASASSTTRSPSNEPSTPSPDRTAAPQSTGEASSTSAGTDAFSEDPAANSAIVAAQDAAAEFVAAWARPDLDPATWQGGLAPHATPELRQALADTDPANVPAVTVSGQPVQVAVNAEAGVFDVPTTGPFIRVFVELVDGIWLASDVQSTAAPEAAAGG
ncbi:hypothetical protein [Cellulomonas cellasea]|uniref:Uncharacterized protein n=1 Tax=Cellulomonas cellasea TaxID=43670 RepID=A0A7W4UHV8_9CELL|nr:hypothetical protein [Cellulomonas cellasea]MBB2924005.1 hypothetical protein [Cellulomonas cellasea]